MPKQFPSQAQLALPLLQEIDQAGGQLRTTDAYDRLAHRFDLDEDTRAARVPLGSDARRTVSAWARHVRFAQLGLRVAGLVHAPEHGVWSCTDAGRDALKNATHGLVVTAYEIKDVGVVLWADAIHAAGVVERSSLALILSSSPYPLVTAKSYRNQHRDEQAHVDWLLSTLAPWIPCLEERGSLVLNVADCWRPGVPALSLWIERLILGAVDQLGLHFIQRFAWHNPAALPAPAQYVCVEKTRCRPSFELALWFAPTTHPQADTTAVAPTPYSPSMERLLRAGGERGARRPSGHALAEGAFARDRGGSLPHTVITCPNTDSASTYLTRCRQAGVQPHPARWPAGLVDFFLDLLTLEGQVVADPFCGSAEVLERCLVKRRRFVGSEIAMQHADTSALRFLDVPGFRNHLPPDAVSRRWRPQQTSLFAA